MLPDNVRAGLNSVRKSRFRSFFTMLGIIIGVVSVITIISLGEGVKRQLSGNITDLGSNILSVRPGKMVTRGNDGKISSVNIFASSGSSITQKDVETIKSVQGVVSASALSSISGLPKYNDTTYKDGVVLATTPDFDKVIDHEIEFGKFLNNDDTARKTAVIGSKVAEKLFKEAVPIGKSLTIKGQAFIVDGVYKQFKESPVSTGINYNNAIFINSSVAQTINGNQPAINEVLVKINPKVSESNTATIISKKIIENHGGSEDFTILSKNDIGEASDEIVKLLTKMIVGMALITLVIAGVGIMNVMLVSVSERNREIGIRKAIGATNSQIRQQFMVESVIISVWGVIFGVFISSLLNFGLRIFTDLEPVLQWQPVILTALLAIGVGVIFGVAPAVKASRKDPIESFRAY